MTAIRYTLSILLVASLTGSVAEAARDSSAAAKARSLGRDRGANSIAEFVPGEILVKTAKGASGVAVSRARGSIGARTVRSFPEIGVELWRLGDGMTVGRAISELRRADIGHAIEYAEPNWIVSAHDLPGDPRIGELWAMHNVGQTGGLIDADIDASEAWDVITGYTEPNEVVIAVIDTGVDYNHEDLAANIWSNPGEVPADGIDNDGNGFVDDVRGWDFVNGDNDPMDDAGHGTHTSGTIGAVGDNGVGIAGVNWTVKILPLKFLNSAGWGDTADAIDAILYAASFDPPIPISNNSWGGDRRSKALENAIRDSNSLFVASAGNSRSSRKSYPAGYSLDNIVSVAATDHDDRLASFSSYGASWVDLAAPGVDILSTAPGDAYYVDSGTSMSAPHVAGVAGLLLAQHPDWTWADIKSQILSTVDPLDSLVDLVGTNGRLNAASAVGAAPEPPTDDGPPGQITDLALDPALPVTETTVSLTWTATGDDGYTGTAFLYDIRYAGAPILSDADFDAATAAEGEPMPQPAGTQEFFTVTGLAPGTPYFFAMKAVDDVGEVSPLSNQVEAETVAGLWTVRVVDTEGEGYLGLDFDPSTDASAVAYGVYGPMQEIRFALWNGTDWDREVVDPREYAGVDLAYDGFGRPTITYGWGKLYANEKRDGSWTRTTVTPGAHNDVTSVRADPQGNLAVAYRANKGLGFARRDEFGEWTTEIVDRGAAARYVALAFDHDGHPAIAYSDDPDDDGWLSALKLARYDGSSWTTELVEEGPVGFGVFAALAFHPEGYPVLMHESTRLLEWDGAAWIDQRVDPDGGPGSVLFASDGTTYAVYSVGERIEMATRAPASPGGTDWLPEVVDPGPAGAFHLPFKFGPLGEGELYVVYNGETGVRLAWRSIP